MKKMEEMVEESGGNGKALCGDIQSNQIPSGTYPY